MLTFARKNFCSVTLVGSSHGRFSVWLVVESLRWDGLRLRARLMDIEISFPPLRTVLGNLLGGLPLFRPLDDPVRTAPGPLTPLSSILSEFFCCWMLYSNTKQKYAWSFLPS